MKILLAALAACFVLWPSPVFAWGPITHLEIARLQNETSVGYRAGSILPDFSLAYRTGGDRNYPTLQSVTHSQEFVDALREVAHADFVAGWEAHIYADSIETPYSRAKIKAGAPASADYVVDYAYEKQHAAPPVYLMYMEWVAYALEQCGCDTPVPDSRALGYIYDMYVSGAVQSNKVKNLEILRTWYYDYEEYVYLAAGVPWPPPPPPPPPPPEPEPPPPPEPEPPEPQPKVSTRTPRPWYSYEAPPERAEAERLKAEEWARISAQMRATDDIAEKLRLFEEWEAFRDAHATPSQRV